VAHVVIEVLVHQALPFLAARSPKEGGHLRPADAATCAHNVSGSADSRFFICSEIPDGHGKM
jgi:hypothetical protein